jgi:hypothetical protein
MMIAPNSYQYYLPSRGNLVITCPIPNEAANRTAISIPRSGVFSYPRGCSAKLQDFTFSDGTMETVDELTEAQQATVNFLDVARSTWPSHFSLMNDTASLLSAAADSNFSEPLINVASRGKLLQLMSNVLSLGNQQTTSRSTMDQFFHYFTGLAILTTSFIASQLYLCCFRRLPEKRHFNLHYFSRAQKVSITEVATEEPAYATLIKNTTGKANLTRSGYCPNDKPIDDIEMHPTSVTSPNAPPDQYGMIQHAALVDDFARTQQYLRAQQQFYPA